jgi:hypothetical protein
MKTKLMLGSFVALLAACGPSAEQKSKAELLSSEKRFDLAMTDSVIADAPAYLISEHHLKGKTKDLNHAVEFLEMYTKQRNGYVENSTTTREILGESSLQISEDTLAKMSNYRMVAELKLRIPYYLLDSAMLHSSALLSYVDQRSLSNYHAEADMIANGLNQATHEIIMEEERNDVLQSKPKHQTKLVQTERKEKHLLQANAAQINNLKLQEKIMYATLNISLYEDEKTEVEKHLMIDQIKPYEPGFFSKLLGSFQEGARNLERLVLGLASLWAWILAAWLSYKAFKHFRRNVVHM